MKPLIKSTLFQNVSSETIEIVAEKNRAQKHTFLIPTKYISPECAQLGYLLNEYFNYKKAPINRINYRTFFGNSRFDAMQGAIKISRHKSLSRKNIKTKTFFLHDPTLEYLNLIDPLGLGEEKALIPGVKVVPDIDTIQSLLIKGERPSAVAICPDKSMNISDAVEILSLCRAKNIISILELSDMDISTPEAFIHIMPLLPDIIVTGESLTDYQIPFGAFSMSEEVHSPWSQINTCYIHSSTYGGNSLSTGRAINNFLSKAPCIKSSQDIQDKCVNITKLNNERLKAFSQYVNPGLVGLYALTGLDIQPIKAHGSILEIETSEGLKKNIIDCVSGGGAAIRGHTPPDIVPEVIKQHDTGKDYWKELAAKFTELSWPHVFPAISGATAVDIAMSMAMISNPEKTKILVFKSNYAGKTLLSLNGSEDVIWRTPFAPLYHDVIYIDPFAIDAHRMLESLLSIGTVALIWFELIQGGTGKEIPDVLIEIINKNKKSGGYIVGIDEIFSGFYRVDSLFSYKNKHITPDIITLAKPLSDGIFPFAVALINSDVYQKALENKPHVVRYIETLYKNQFGSHIALHSVEKILSPEFIRNLLKVSEILSQGLHKIALKSPLIKAIHGKGHFYQFYYEDKNPILRISGELGRSMFMLYMCRLIIKEADVFLFFDRCLPSLALSETEATTLIKNLETVLVTHRPSFLYLKFFGFMIRVVINVAFDSLKMIMRKSPLHKF